MTRLCFDLSQFPLLARALCMSPCSESFLELLPHEIQSLIKSFIWKSGYQRRVYTLRQVDTVYCVYIGGSASTRSRLIGSEWCKGHVKYAGPKYTVTIPERPFPVATRSLKSLYNNWTLFHGAYSAGFECCPLYCGYFHTPRPWRITTSTRTPWINMLFLEWRGKMTAVHLSIVHHVWEHSPECDSRPVLYTINMRHHVRVDTYDEHLRWGGHHERGMLFSCGGNTRDCGCRHPSDAWIQARFARGRIIENKTQTIPMRKRDEYIANAKEYRKVRAAKRKHM